MKVAVIREKDDALVVQMNESKYSEVLKAMRSDAKLEDLKY